MKKVLIIVGILIVLIVGIILICNNKNTQIEQEREEELSAILGQEENEESVIEGKVDIIDINSNSRPYAIVINNTAVAVKVQEGLNKAYLVYEIPTEGNTSRLLAFYKDVEEDLVIGTIRSARHNFIDFALESDAILCCFGWSTYAEYHMKGGSIDYLQGLYDKAFYRKNPEKLASEHTAYTSINKLKKDINKKGFRTTTNDSILLNYNISDIDLSSAKEVKEANKIIIPYGSSQYISSFEYNKDTKMYTRYQKNEKCIDHNTKEEVTTKNIIVQKLGYEMCPDNYYWSLNTIGSGEGYYITNGYAVEINWQKLDYSNKTKYTYKEGTILNGKDVGGQEIFVSDGRTWIEIQTTKQPLTIE